MTRERLTFGHGVHVPVPRASATAAAALLREPAKVHLSRPETWDWAWGGLLIFTILVFFRPQDQLSFLANAHLANIAAVGGLTAMIGISLSRRLPITRVTPELVALAFFGFVIAITVPLSYWPGGAFDTFKSLYIPVLLTFVLMINTMTTPRRVERIAWVIVLAFGFMSVRVCADYLRGLNIFDGRANGPVGGMFQNPNDLALNLASFLPLALLFMRRPGSFLKRAISAGIALAMLAAIVFTKSRGGALGTVAMLITYLVAGRVLTPATTIGLVLAGMLTLPALPQSFWGRMESITDGSKDANGSREERRLLLHQGWEVFLEHPLTGVGAGQFRGYWHPGLARKWHEVHNVWLQVAAEIGIFGVLAYAFLVARAFGAVLWTRRRLTLWRRRRSKAPKEPEDGLADDERDFLQTHATAVLAAMVGWFVCSMFASVALNWTFYYLLGLAVTSRDVVRTRAAAYARAKAQALRAAVAA